MRSIFSIQKQLYARVIRYKSHNHLPVSKRKEKIYERSCTLLYDFNKIVQGRIFFNKWLNLGDINKSILNIILSFKD